MMFKLNLYHSSIENREIIDKNPIPLGDKGIPGERDDMFSPRATDKYERYEHLQRYKYAAKRCQGKILDLGCGTGYGTKILSEKSDEVYGVDNSQKAVDYARKIYPGPLYTCCSAEKLPYEDNFFDAVVVFEVIEHFQDVEKALDEVYRVLKKNGDFFISTPNPRHFGKMIKHLLFKKPYPEKVGPNIYHIKEFYYDEFLDLLKKKQFKVKFKYGQTLPIFPRKIMYLLKKLPFLYKIPIFLGYCFPKYAGTIVVWAKK